MRRRRSLHALALGLALGSPAVAQEAWPRVELDADLAAAEAWVEDEAPPRQSVETWRAAGWRVEVVVDREASQASARAIRPDGRLAWSFPAAGDAFERIDVVHVGVSPGHWLEGPDAALAACVVLR